MRDVTYHSVDTQALYILTNNGNDPLKEGNEWKIIKFFDVSYEDCTKNDNAGCFYAEELGKSVCNSGQGTYRSCGNISSIIKNNTDLKEVYIANYMATPQIDGNYNFNRYLRRMKKSTYDNTSYRLIGIFESDGNTRYASIKIDNPNPNRSENLGGE